MRLYAGKPHAGEDAFPFSWAPATLLREWLALSLILMFLPVHAHAQRKVGVVPVGNRSTAAAINPITNKIYVVNQGDNSVTVVDGATHASTAVPVGKVPLSVAVNPLTNRIYVADSRGTDQFGRLDLGGITMIDANNNNATIYRSDPTNLGGQPQVVAVDPVTNLVFASNVFGASVSVFDGNLVYKTTVTLGSGGGQFPIFTPDLAVDTARARVYASGSIGQFGEGVTLIDEKDLANPHPIQISVGAPDRLVVDEVTNRIFVLGELVSPTGQNLGPGVSITDIGTCQTTNPNLPPCVSTSISFPPGSARAIALNPATHKVYFGGGASVTVIDGSQSNNPTNSIGLPPNVIAGAIAANPLTNRIYVSSPGGNPGTGSVFVIDGTSDALVGGSISNDASPVLAVNPLTNRVYTTAPTSQITQDNLVVIDGATEALSSLVSQNTAGPNAIAVNPVTHKVYVANTGFDSRTNTGIASISVFDPTQTNPVKSPIFDLNASQPAAVAVDFLTNQIYVANNASNNVTVINGTTDSYQATLSDPKAVGPIAVAVNPVNNKVYVANNGSGNVTIIDGWLNKIITTVPGGPAPFALAVNNFVSHVSGQAVHKIYVVNNVPTAGTVTEIDGDTDTVTNTIAAGGFPFAIGVNPLTNHVWVANDGTKDMTMFDAETHQTVRVSDPNGSHPRSVGVGPASDGVQILGKIYVGNQGSNNVTIINDSFPFPFSTVPVGTNPSAIAVNPNTNHIYVANLGSDNISLIDGASNSVSTFKDPFAFGPIALGVDPAFNQAYVANSDFDDQGAVGSDAATAINEQQFQPNPLQTSITSLLTTSLTPTFNFVTSSSFSPFIPRIDNLFFQFDSWEAPWTPASAAGANAFSASPSLQPGSHFLYGFATDSRETTAGILAKSVAPFTGSITPYLFVAGATSLPLTVTVAGPGTLTSNPPGISCPSVCAAGFAPGTVITLTATPATAAVFAGWGGACTGAASTCSVTVNAATSLTANFIALVNLTITKAGTRSGTVTSNPTGIDCGTACTASFTLGSVVQLTATPATGAAFVGWTGACRGVGKCSVAMTANKSVGATFNAGFVLTVTRTGTRRGTVLSSPPGINCGTACSFSFTSGSLVRLGAIPARGARFIGWGGACRGTAPICSVRMIAAQSVTAAFQ
jgi:YVTN family beta-propeller protein